MTTQWERLLKNQGTWVGSFIQVASSGEILQDVPAEVVLQPLDGGKTMHQVIRKFPGASLPIKSPLIIALWGGGCCFVKPVPFPRDPSSGAPSAILGRS